MSWYEMLLIWTVIGLGCQAVILSEQGMDGIRPKDKEEAFGVTMAIIVIALIWPVVFPEAFYTTIDKAKRLLK